MDPRIPSACNIMRHGLDYLESSNDSVSQLMIMGYRNPRLALDMIDWGVAYERESRACMLRGRVDTISGTLASGRIRMTNYDRLATSSGSQFAITNAALGSLRVIRRKYSTALSSLSMPSRATGRCRASLKTRSCKRHPVQSLVAQGS